MSETISRDAELLIVESEVSGKGTYELKYRKPEWPGASSGVTIGIGYDVGYATKPQLWGDWKGHIPDTMIATLERAIGVKGGDAAPLARALRADVDVPWEEAIAVHENTVIPRWIAKVKAALPNTDKLSPDCLGALVSLAYNRGPAFSNTGDRFREMRAIKDHMQKCEFEKIPAEFRAMKRLWPDLKGLLIRRDKEAELFERGLKPVEATS